MLVQKPYIQPYIPEYSNEPEYIGGELAQLTSDTPFWASQGIPIYPFTPVKKAINLDGCCDYGDIVLGLQKGVKGQSVADLQAALNKAGGYGLDVDGDFGSKTENALIQFQKTNSLAQTGKVDNATLAKLNPKLSAQIGQAALTVGSSFFTTYLQNVQNANTASTPNAPLATPVSSYQPQQGMSTTTKVAIATAGVFGLGLLVWAATKK